MKKLKGWPSWHACVRLAGEDQDLQTSGQWLVRVLERWCSCVMHSWILNCFAVSEGFGSNNFRGWIYYLSLSQSSHSNRESSRPRVVLQNAGSKKANSWMCKCIVFFNDFNTIYIDYDYISDHANQWRLQEIQEVMVKQIHTIDFVNQPFFAKTLPF